MARTEQELKEIRDLLDRVLSQGPEQAISWLQGAYYSLSENVALLREELERVRKRLLAMLPDLLSVEDAGMCCVCRVCRGPATGPFVMNYGKEHAHQRCLAGAAEVPAEGGQS